MDLKKILLNILIAFIIFYLVFGLILYVNQRSMLYFPNNQDFNNCVSFKDYQKINYNGTRLYVKTGFENVIVIYHGNAGSACDRDYFKSYFKDINYSIIVVEYIGYSNDTIKPTKNLIFNDVKNVNNYLKENQFKKTTVYGESIGTGAATYHANIGKVDDLILITPFSKLENLVQSKYIIYPASIMLKDKYDNIQMLQNFKGKLIIFHGNKDLVIPTKFSKELFDEVSTENKKYILIDGAGHNDIWYFPDFDIKMKEIVSNINK